MSNETINLPLISGSAGGDLSGTYPDPEVIAIEGVVVSGTPSSGQVLTATSSTAADWATPASGFTAGGDLSGSNTSQKVIGIDGYSLPSLPLSDGYLNYTGSAWQYSAITIPTTLPPSGSAGGDLSGSYPNPTVNSAVNGLITFSNASGYANINLGSSLYNNIIYEPGNQLVLKGTNSQTTISLNDNIAFNTFLGQPVIIGNNGVGGDAAQIFFTTAVSNPSLAPTNGVVVYSDSSTSAFSLLDVNGNVLNLTGTTISQPSTSGATGNNLTISPQASTNISGTPGNLIINIAAPTGAGGEGFFEVQRAGTVEMTAGNVPGYTLPAIWLGQSSPSLDNRTVCVSSNIAQLNGTGGAAFLVNGSYALLANSTTDVGANSSFMINAQTNAGVYGGGVGVLGMAMASTDPSGAISGGGVLYVDSSTGSLMFIGSSGIARLVALA